jgi:hypothetical protein
VQFSDVFIELTANFVESLQIIGDIAGFLRLQCQTSAQFLNDLTLVGFMAVAGQTEVGKALVSEAALNHLQRRRFLTDEQYGFPSREEFGDDVGDCLTLPCPWRSVKNQAGAARGGGDGFVLAAVRVKDVEGPVRVGLMIEFLGAREVSRVPKRNSGITGDRPAEVAFRDTVPVPSQILPHGQFLKAKRPQRRLVQHLPAG